MRTISRFGVSSFTDDEGNVGWIASGSRHWFLDRAGPRPEEQVRAAAEAILRLQAERDEAQAEEAEEVGEAGETAPASRSA